MAYPTGNKSQGIKAASTTVELTLCPHTSGNLLLALVVQDVGGASAMTINNSWTRYTGFSSNRYGSNFQYELFYKIAGGSETNPTVTSSGGSVSDDWAWQMWEVDDFDATTPIHAVSASNEQNVNYAFANTLTTTNNDCLIFHLAAGKTAARQIAPVPVGLMPLDRNTAASGQDVHSAVMWSYMETAGAIPQRGEWSRNFTALTASVDIAINDVSGGGDRKGYIDPSTQPVVTLFNNVSGSTTTAYPNQSAAGSNASSLIAAIDGVTLGPASSVNGNYSTNQYWWRVLGTFVSQTSAGDPTLLTSAYCRPSSTVDLSDGLFSFVAQGSAANTVLGKDIAYNGCIVAFADASGNFRAYTVTADDVNPPSAGLSVFTVDLNSNTGLIDSSGTLDKSAVRDFVFCFQDYKDLSVTWSVANFIKANEHVLIGGSANTPATFADFVDYSTGAASELVLDQSGRSYKQFTSLAELQVGNGTDTTYFKQNGGALAFGKKTDPATRYYLCNIDAGRLGLTLYGVSGDSIEISDFFIGQETLGYFTIDASSTSAATWNFNALQIFNCTCTLAPIGTIGGMIFNACPEIDHNGFDFSGGCTIKNCTDTRAILITSQAELNKLANCVFTGNSVAIEINVDVSVTTLNFPGITFGSTNTIAVKYTNDHDIDFTVSDGCDLTIDKVTETGDGTVTLDTGAVITISAPNLLNGTRCRLVNVTNSGAVTSITRSSSTATVTKTAHGLETGWDITIVGADQVEYNGNHVITVTSADTFTYTVSGTPATPATGDIDLEHEINNVVTSGGSGYSLTVTVDTNTEIQSGDSIVLLGTYQSGGTAKNVFRGSAVAGSANITFPDSQSNWVFHNTVGIDGSGVSECDTDFVEIQVEIDDADNVTTKARIAAFIVNALTTEDGIRYWVALDGTPIIDYVNAGSALIDAAVASLKIDNIKNAPLSISDAFKLRASDGSSLVSDTTYTIRYDNTDEAVIVETGVSGLTTPESERLFSTATATQANALQSDVTAVKAKTDNLPASPAATGDIPSVAAIAAGVISAAESSPIHADIRKVNNEPIGGSGTEADPFGPA